MQRFAIREGWSTVLLTAIVVFISVLSIQRADWADGLGILNLVALAGLAAGVAVSKTQRVPVVVAHLLAAFAGLLVVLFQMTNYLDDRLGTRRQKLDWLWDRGQRWGGQIWNGEQTDDLYLFVFFISLLTYVLAFSSMWFVLRARWIWAALVFPGLLLFINLGYSLRVPTGYVALYIFFSLLLLVRFSLLERETFWRRMRIDYPSSLAWRGMWAATYLGIFVIMFGWAFPASARSGTAHDAWLQVDGPWRSVESQFNTWFAGLRGTGSRGVGGFASFSDSFDLGGPLSLSDAPVVLVSGASNSPYLAAHRYSVYTGRGWESEFAVSNDDDEPREVPPQVELQPGESVAIDPAVVDGRDTRSYTVQLQRPRGSLVFAPETYSSADIGVNLVLPWLTVTDATVDLAAEELTNVPVELVALIQLLQATDFTPPELETEPTEEADATETTTSTANTTATATSTPETTPPPPPPPVVPMEVTRELQALVERGIVADYSVDLETYQATSLTYSGEFPVYDDVEAVYAREGLAGGQTYEVESLESQALSADLRIAGVDYPQLVRDRYLQLPATITPRTSQLALDITAGAATPYDAAKAVENWLRNNVVYQEDIEFPPEDADVVDYVLFESRAGYCEYYASSFVVMMRSLGIPTRMVTGFFPTERDAEAGGFLYRERNAHAWPEVYFPGEGWVQFEPTANREEISREPIQSDGTGIAPIDPEIGGEGTGMLPFDDELGFDERSGGPVGGGAGIQDANDPVTRTEWAIRAVTLSLMVLILAITFSWLRGMRGLSPAAQLYTKASRGSGWGGVRYEPHMTP
ncbi:MAG: transglutaminase-like domain-containing protein, partial [Chloroflexota bacterium]|nr:transglutaminase-like domain-containing protein [Chloroflexota bacterium]